MFRAAHLPATHAPAATQGLIFCPGTDTPNVFRKRNMSVVREF
jgi:hypothetical protein